jgi:indolepyruvate ferredoxin oxidoreductase alpha subunit
MVQRPRTHPLLEGKAGARLILLGNEAIARGALEAGLQYAATYPGTPSAEIGDTLNSLGGAAGFIFEYAVNEKVAMETAGVAAISGMRALVSMKHVGLNVAADAFMSLAYTGVRGALVVVSADDPGCHSSQNEQDNRRYAQLADVPMLEPATPQQALEMTREAFRLSSDLQVPVLLRTTTRVSHARGPVILGALRRTDGHREFISDKGRFLLTPSVARRDHRRLLQCMDRARRAAETSRFNVMQELGPSPRYGVMASGAAVNYVKDVLRDEPVALLQVGFTHPLPEAVIQEFLRRFPQVVVVEELDPYLEEGIRSLAQREGISTRILGKADGLFPYFGEMSPDIVREGFSALGWTKRPEGAVEGGQEALLPRPPVLCPGCGHRAAVYAAKRAARRLDVHFTTDIGCYTLTSGPPLEAGETLLCMGASISAASGIYRATGKRTIALIGDSTFYHAGMPPLINAVHHGHDILVVILDNSTTAMTGHQPHPGVVYDGKSSVSLEEVVRGCGVRFVRVVDPYDVKATLAAFREALQKEGVSVVICRHPCRLLESREILRTIGQLPLYAVDVERCTRCLHCIDSFGCPALMTLEDGRIVIDPDLCTGCGVCAAICPPGAISEVGREAA